MLTLHHLFQVADLALQFLVFQVEGRKHFCLSLAFLETPVFHSQMSKHLVLCTIEYVSLFLAFSVIIFYVWRDFLSSSSGLSELTSLFTDMPLLKFHNTEALTAFWTSAHLGSWWQLEMSGLGWCSPLWLSKLFDTVFFFTINSSLSLLHWLESNL